MSRTYRCRNLPVAHGHWGGAARKIVDGHGGSGGWKHRRDIIDAIATETLGPRPEVDTKWVRWGIHYNTVITYQKDFWVDKEGKWRCSERPHWNTVKLPGHWITTWEAFEWDRLRDQIDRDYVWPTGSWHPWARRRMPTGPKTRLKRRANKEMRHRSRQIVGCLDPDAWDDWEGEFPNKRTHYNKRDLY